MFWTLSWFTVGPVLRAMFRPRFEGKRNIPKKGPAILASNHLSFLDHLIAPLGTRRQIFFISKVEHFERPFRRWLFRRWGVIPLRRGAGDRESFEKAVEILGSGHLFGIYPEGTRSLDGKLHKGHTGVARLATLTKAPVIPVAMIGTFEALPKGKKFPRLLKVKVRYGKPLDYSRHHGKEADRELMRKVTDEIMEHIAQLSGQEYVDAYQHNPAVRSHAHQG